MGSIPPDVAEGSIKITAVYPRKQAWISLLEERIYFEQLDLGRALIPLLNDVEEHVSHYVIKVRFGQKSCANEVSYLLLYHLRVSHNFGIRLSIQVLILADADKLATTNEASKFRPFGYLAPLTKEDMRLIAVLCRDVEIVPSSHGPDKAVDDLPARSVFGPFLIAEGIHRVLWATRSQPWKEAFRKELGLLINPFNELCWISLQLIVQHEKCFMIIQR